VFPSTPDIPQGPLEVLLWPLILVIIGLVVWYIGLRIEFNTEKGFVKWISMIPLGIATLMGASSILRITDFAYREVMNRRMTLYAHYLALILPVLAIGAIVGWEWYQKRQRRTDLF
jgi:hypothetical protein